MNNRNTGLIATIATAVLCGCPGLFAMFWGTIAAAVSFFPGADINIGGSSDPSAALFTGLGALCVGLLFVGIPVAVAFFTFRRKPENSQELPPTS